MDDSYLESRSRQSKKSKLDEKLDAELQNLKFKIKWAKRIEPLDKHKDFANDDDDNSDEEIQFLCEKKVKKRKKKKKKERSISTSPSPLRTTMSPPKHSRYTRSRSRSRSARSRSTIRDSYKNRRSRTPSYSYSRIRSNTPRDDSRPQTPRVDTKKNDFKSDKAGYYHRKSIPANNDDIDAYKKPLSPPRYYPRKRSTSPPRRSLYDYRCTKLSDHFIKSKSCLQTVAPPMNYSKDRSNDAHEDERSVYFDTKHPSPNEYPKKGHFSPHVVYDDDNSHSSKSREQSRNRSMSREMYFDRVRSRSPQRDLRLKLTSESAGRQYTKDRSVTPAKRNISSSQYLDDDNEKLNIEIKKLQDLLDNKDIELKKVKSKADNQKENLTNLLRIQRENKEENTQLKYKFEKGKRNISTMAKKLNENKKQIQLLEAANNQISENNLNLLGKIDKIVAKNGKLQEENDKLKLLVDKLKWKNNVDTNNAKKILTGDTTGVNTDLNRKNDIAAKLLKLVELETECQAKDNTIAALTTEIQEKSNQICSLQENNKHILLDLGSLHTNYLESEQNLKNLNNKFQEQKILIKCQRTEIEKLKAEMNACGKVDMFSPPENDNNEESEESSPSDLKKRITDLEVELKMKNTLLVESTTIRENMEEEFSQSLTAIEQENANEIMKIKALYHDKIHKLEEELRKIKHGIVFDSNQDFNHKSKEGEAALDSMVSEKDEEYANNVDILMNNVSKWSFHELDGKEEQSIGVSVRTDNSGDKAEEKICDSVIAATDDDSKKDRKNSGDSGIHTDDDRGQNDDDNRDIKIPADDSDTNIQTVRDQTFPSDYIQADYESVSTSSLEINKDLANLPLDLKKEDIDVLGARGEKRRILQMMMNQALENKKAIN